MAPDSYFSAVAAICRLIAINGEDINHGVNVLLARNTVEIYQKN